MGILVNIHPSMGAPIVDALRALAPDVQVWAHRDEAPAAEVEAMLAWSLKPGVLPAYPQLKLLCAPSAGVDKLLAVPDLPVGLPVARTVDPQQHVEIAQYVVGTALRHTRELDLFARQQQAGDWLRRPVRASADCRVGILGLGEVGRFVAGAMQAVGYPVAGWSRSSKSIAGLATVSSASGALANKGLWQLPQSVPAAARRLLHQRGARRAGGRGRAAGPARRRPSGRCRAGCAARGAAPARQQGVEAPQGLCHAAYRGPGLGGHRGPPVP